MLRRAGAANDALPGAWLSYGRTQGETRYSTLKQIDTTNAKRMGLAWSYVMGAGGSNQEGTPLMWNNTLYGITTWSVVFALDARTGKELWRWDPEVNQTTVRPMICCGIVNRGLAIYNGMIIAPAIDGRLFALNAIDRQAGLGNARGVSAGSVHIDHGAAYRGRQGDHRRIRWRQADARVNSLQWMRRQVNWPGASTRFPATPPSRMRIRRCAPRQKPGAANSTRTAAAARSGMASLMTPKPISFTWAPAMPSPGCRNFAGAQNVDNLYTCSILAVDLTTGQLKWYYQTVPNDNWDYDSVQQLMLLDLNINGRMRKVIMQAPKNGFFYVLDRVTGEFISAEPFVKVSWALRMGEGGRPVVNPAAYYDQEPISVYPTGGGAHNWSAMSYNPSTGLVYIPASYSSFPYQAQVEHKPGTTGYVRPSGETKIIEPSFGPEPPKGARGGLQAWDPLQKKLRWNIEGGGGIGGGTTTTAGNVVFQTINDGRFRVVSADNGEILYEVKTGRTGIAPPITYEVEGKQYVAFGGGLGRAATVVGPNNAKIDNPPIMFVFALDGNAEMPSPAPPPAPGPAAAPAGPAPEQKN